MTDTNTPSPMEDREAVIQGLRDHVRYKYMPAMARDLMERAADILSRSPQAEEGGAGEALYNAEVETKAWFKCPPWSDLTDAERAGYDATARAFLSRQSPGGGEARLKASLDEMVGMFGGADPDDAEGNAVLDRAINLLAELDAK